MAPVTFQTPLGEEVTVDCPGLVCDLIPRVDCRDPAAVRAAMFEDPSLPARILAQVLGEAALHGLPCDRSGRGDLHPRRCPAGRRIACQLGDGNVARMADSTGDYKVIVSMRTEYYGRLVDSLRQGAGRTDSGSVTTC